jgi:hypothetical protein
MFEETCSSFPSEEAIDLNPKLEWWGELSYNFKIQ